MPVVATSMPQLVLSIYIARIITYQAPPTCGRLPLLSVGSKQFLECRESVVNDGRLRYVPVPSSDNPLVSELEYEHKRE